jgi:putative endonuclease
MSKTYYVSIVASATRTLYIGVTNNLQRRVYEHKQREVPGFTKKYHITQLVYYEETSDVRVAISREKQLKAWSREKKISLIEAANPNWRDLSEDWKD